MTEYEINQRIFQLIESLNMRELAGPNIMAGYTVTGEAREELKGQLYAVLSLPVNADANSINMRINALLQAIRSTEVDEKNQFVSYLFAEASRDNLIGKLVEVLKVKL